MDIGTSLAIMLALISFSAFTAASEVALLTISRIRLRTLLKGKAPGAESLSKLKSEPRRMIITVLMANNIANVGASVLAADIALSLFNELGLGIATLVMSFVMLTVGDVIPKSLATTSHSGRFALFVAKPMLALEFLFSPLIRFFEFLTRLVPGVYAVPTHAILLTEEDVRTTVEVGFEDKAITAEEKKLLTAVLNFSDLRAKDVLLPRDRVLCLHEADITSRIASRLSRLAHSRFPILNTQGEVTGVVDLSHILRAHTLSAPVLRLAKEPFFASKELPAIELLRSMQKEEQRMAIIVDEFGKFEGIVTIEDLFEELVGQIGPQDQLHHLSSKILVASGDARLQDIEEALGLKLPPSDADSLSLFLHKHLQRIPREGDTVLLRNCRIQVTKMHKNSVVRALLHKM